MVKETGVVSADIGVADPASVHGEAPDAALRQVLRFALIAFLVIDQLAGVLDNPAVLVDGFLGEDAETVHFGTTTDDTGQYEGTIH